MGIFRIIFILLLLIGNISYAQGPGVIEIVDYVTTLDGKVYPVKRGIIAASSSGNNQLVAAVAGKTICVTSYSYNTAGAVNVKFRSANTDISGLYSWLANQGIAPARDPNCIYRTAVNEALNLNLSGAVAVGGDFRYAEIP